MTVSTTNWANGMTVLRVVLVPVIAVLVLNGGTAARWWSLLLFSVAAATDWLDGWLARRSGDVTRWGQMADPAADKVLIVGTLVALAVNGALPWLAVAVIVAREGAVTLQRQLLLRRNVIMPASRFGKLKTVTQMIAVVLYLLPPASDTVADAALGVAVVATIASGVEYAARGRKLAHGG